METNLLESKYRGETSLRQFICDLLNLYCHYYPDSTEFIVHHKNDVHEDNRVRNIILLPNYIDKKNWNSSLHNKFKNDEMTMSNEAYLKELINANAIDVFKSLKQGAIVNPAKTNISLNLLNISQDESGIELEEKLIEDISNQRGLMMIKDKKLNETSEGKDELDLYLNNEEWAYRRLEKIVTDGIAKKWSKRAITFGVAREIYNLKDAFGRIPTNRQERLEIANDFVEALLPDDYMEESLKEENARNKDIFSCYADELKKARGRDADRLYRKIKADKNIDKIQLQGLTDIYAANRNLNLEESLKEDIDTVVPEKDDTTVLSASTLPVANKLIEAINGEWDTIVLYNNIITELKENNFDDIIPVIQDIVKEENTHVGQLQKALSTISPDTNDIASGEVEAEGQLNESLYECDEYSDDFETDDESELYRTGVKKEIPYGKNQKRLRDRQLVDRDGERIYHPVREETECQCVDIDNEDRVYEREIRMALEDGTLTKDDIVEYTLKNTPDEMLHGMLSMKFKKGIDDAIDFNYDAIDSSDDLTADEANFDISYNCEGELCDEDLKRAEDECGEPADDGKKGVKKNQQLNEIAPVVAAALISAAAPIVAKVADQVLPGNKNEELQEEEDCDDKMIEEIDSSDDLDESIINTI